MRALALAVTALTGFAGLVYEVAWQKYLAILMGAQSEATAAILAIFLGGLSLGYWLWGRASVHVSAADPAARAARLLLLYAAIEAAIGVWALLFPLLFRAAQAATGLFAIESPALGLALDGLLATLLIGPPTILMGATIPLLTQALARDLDDATRIHALVYGFNTAGAFAGALAAGFWLIAALGLVGVLVAMAALNLAAAAVFAAIARRAARGVAAPAAEAPSRVAGFAIYAAAALCIGFAMTTLQAVLIRVGGLALGASHVTFSLVVSVFVLCIALGSFGVSALSRIRGGLLVANAWLLALAFGALYFGVQDAGYWTHALRSLFRDDPHGLWLFRLAVFGGLLVAIGPAVVLSGATLPLLFHHLRHYVTDLGAVAGRLYSWNTVGSVLGAVVGGYLLFLPLDLDGVFRVAVAALAVAAALLTTRVARVRWLGLAALAPALVALALLPRWDAYRLSLGTFRYRQPQATTFAGPDAYFRDRQQRSGERILFYDDDPIASVAVREFPYGETRSRAILTNGKSDGALVGDYTTTALAAVLPALFAERTERALVIGWGTGVTAGELASLDSMREVVVAEISRGVMAAAPWFEHGNLGARANRKVRVVQTDAYRALLRSEGRYDLIVSEPSNPWVSGVEMLFSREFLEAARDRLNPGGVYTQWFPLYETDDETVALVLRTLASVFGDAAVWNTTGPDLLLLGFREGGAGADADLARLLERKARADFAATLERAGIRDVPALLAHELMPRGALAQLELPGAVHTLLHPLLADRAARAFFAGDRGRLPSLAAADAARAGASRSLLRRWAASREGGKLSVVERDAAAREACRYRMRECAVLLAQWRAEQPDNPLLRVRIEGARRQPPSGDAIDEHLVGNLSLLFDARRIAPADPGTSLAIAEQASELFVEYFHPAAPFSRDALRALWSQCAADARLAERCAASRAALERRIGSLAQSVDGAAASASAAP
ncbi:MAG: hypothetical protein DCC71_04740 [Proteobacteria bacterium]|nr:MAG: hypothetical protein DCC71_04740 [Pseudomonadota bacterium]